MTRCIEQKICNITLVSPDKRILFNDWFMEMDLPIWINSGFECMNIPIDDPHQTTLLLSKRVRLGYNIVYCPHYDNLKLEKHGYHEHFGEYCVKWFLNEM